MEKLTDQPFLEALELRIAPASLLSFTDADGDAVKVKLTGGGTVTGDQTGLTLTDTDPLTSALKITVKKARLGDGFADLDSVTGDGLKSLTARMIDFTGTGIAMTGALGKITVHDLLNGADITSGGTTANESVLTAGHLSAGSQISLGSTLTSLTALDADGDKYIIALKGAGGFQGDLNGLSLVNTTFKSSFGIAVKAMPGGDGMVDLAALDAGSGFAGLAAINASSVNLTDHLVLNTSVGKIALGGIHDASITLGGTTLEKTTFSGGEISNSNLAFGGTLESFMASQFDSGFLSAAAITSLAIGDAKSGWAGDLGAAVEAGSISSAVIKHDLTGSLNADATLGSVIIGHDVVGGASRASGAILAGASIGSVVIGGDLQGGSGELSGTIFQYNGDLQTDQVHTLINPGSQAAVQTTSIVVNGSVIGGTGDYSGGILVHNVNALTIQGDLMGGDNTTSGDLRNTGFIYGTLINTLTIGQSILAGNNTGGGTLENSGAINLRSYVGVLSVGQDILGSATHDVTLTSFGLVEQTSNGSGIFGQTGNQLGFGKITVTGNVVNAGILAGVDGTGFDNVSVQTNNPLATGTPGDLDPAAVNAHVAIGKVTIGGNLTDSQIVAGYTPGNDGIFGTTDDVAGTAIGSVAPYSGSASRIAAVVVGGEAGAVGSALSSGLHGQITVMPGASFPLIHSLSQLNIVFNYDYDTSGFFSDPARRVLLDEAAEAFESRLPASDFAAITPGDGNTWTLSTFDPSHINSPNLHLSNEILSEGTIVIYVGASSGDTGTLAQGSPASYSETGSQDWLNTFTDRNNSSVYHTIGGSIRFNSSVNFYFDSDPTTMESFSGEDFYSIAIHEIGHVMGFLDSAAAFHSNEAKISGTTFFAGTHAEALYGGPVPLSSEKSHWKDGITYNGQELSMDPTIAYGTRKTFTELDWAALEDIGYHVQPA